MRTLLFIIIFFLVCCCKQNTKTQQNNESSLDFPRIIDLGKLDVKNKSLRLSEVAEKIEYIPLETRENAFVANTFSFQVADSFLFVKNVGEILTFSQDGQFIANFPAQGRGPGEGHIRTFVVDEEEKLVYAYGNFTHTLMPFTNEGKCLEKNITLNADDAHLRKMFVGGNYLATVNSFNVASDIFSQVQHIKTGEVIYSYNNPYLLPERLKNSSQKLDIASKELVAYQSYGDSLILMKEAFSDTLFQTTDFKKFSPRYIFTYQAPKITYEEYMSVLCYPTENMHVFENGFSIDSYYETSSFLWIMLGKMGLYDKRNAKLNVYDTPIIENDIDGGPDLNVNSQNCYAQWIYKDKLYNLIWPLDLLDEEEQKENPSEEVKKLYKSISEEDNPVLMIVTLKTY